jgi:type II secretory pathway pseudopilin PulG
MRKLIVLALLGAIATAVAKTLPDIRRYRRMRDM